MGVKQGENYSPTLFSIFIDDFAQKINSLQLGINTGDTKVYADAYNEEDMLCLLDKLHDWCK